MQTSWCDGSGKEVVFVGYERPRQRETTHMINKVRTTVHYRRPDCISHSRLSSAALCRLRLLLWTRLHIPHYLLWLRKCGAWTLDFLRRALTAYLADHLWTAGASSFTTLTPTPTP